MLLADSEDHDQTVRMRRLVWAFAVRIEFESRFLADAAYIKAHM